MLLKIGYNDLQALDPELAKQFDIKKNGITPDKVLYGGKTKWWWNCSICNQSWQASIQTRKKGHGCSVCKNLSLSEGYNDLQTLNPDLASQFDVDKNGITPDKVLYGGDKKWWWICSTCKQSWKESLYNRKKSSDCPVCKNRIVIVGYNDLQTTNPEILIDWDYSKNNISPTEIGKGSGKRVFWKCHICKKEWGSRVVDMTSRKLNGCYDCAQKNKTLSV